MNKILLALTIILLAYQISSKTINNKSSEENGESKEEQEVGRLVETKTKHDFINENSIRTKFKNVATTTSSTTTLSSVVTNKPETETKSCSCNHIKEANVLNMTMPDTILDSFIERIRQEFNIVQNNSSSNNMSVIIYLSAKNQNQTLVKPVSKVALNSSSDHFHHNVTSSTSNWTKTHHVFHHHHEIEHGSNLNVSEAVLDEHHHHHMEGEQHLNVSQIVLHDHHGNNTKSMNQTDFEIHHIFHHHHEIEDVKLNSTLSAPEDKVQDEHHHHHENENL